MDQSNSSLVAHQFIKISKPNHKIELNRNQPNMICLRIPTWFIGLLKVSLIVFLFFFITMLLIIIQCRQLIMDNWDEYRCNPMIIPLAWLFGHSSEDTMNECMLQNFKATSATMFNPFTNMFGVFSDTFNIAGQSVNDMNFVLGSVKNVFASGFSNILSRIGNISSAIQYLLIKMEVLLQRLAATLVVAMYSLYSMLQGLRAIKNDKPLLNAVDKLLQLPKF